MKLPKDLPGGWTFHAPFNTAEFKVGQVWRKCGPVDALRIERILLPGYPRYDGGAPGISVRQSTVGSSGIYWSKKTWFKLGTFNQLMDWMQQHGYSLAEVDQ